MSESQKQIEKTTKPEQTKKKKDEKELSEEDQRIKENIDLIVERVKDSNINIQKMALESLREELKNTGTVTSIPKPLKYLRHHYDELKNFYYTNTPTDPEIKALFADIMSLVAMSSQKEGARECLKFKLDGSQDLGVWGHEYVRYLAGEIGQEYQHRSNDNPDLTREDIKDLQPLIDKIVPFMIKSNAEPEAIDLLMEVEQLESIEQYTDKQNYRRVCLYLTSTARYLLEPENRNTLLVAYNIFKKLNEHPSALHVALQMGDMKLIQETFDNCDDPDVKKQLAFMLGRQRIKLETDDFDLQEIMSNNFLSEHYLYLAKELDMLEPKTPEDIYKSHLTETRSTLTQNIDSARKNLASTFVNAFVNAGFGTDKLMTTEGNRWLYKNKEHGMMSAAASLGLIYLWNVSEGLTQVDKYLYASDNYIKAGALMAQGIINAGVTSDYAKELLEEYVEGSNRDLRIGAILGLGIGYAGTAHEGVLELLLPILADDKEPLEIIAFAALSLGLTFAGTCNEDITGTIVQVLMSEDRLKDLKDTLARFLILGLGLLFLGKQEASDAILETTKVLDKVIAKQCEVTVLTCAYAGSGNVLKVQQLLKICGEKIDKEKESNAHQAIATLGIALIAMGEELGAEMAIRSFDHLLQYADLVVKRAVPLGLGLLCVSNPKLTVMDTLSKLSHDIDAEVAQGAILGLGLIGAGTNNARIAQLLRQLSGYYAKDPNCLFMVRIAQGILYMGKGLITLSPYHMERTVMNIPAMSGLLTLLHSSLDMKNIILGKYHYLLYVCASAMYPRMLVTVDEELKPIAVNVRVGQAVDIVAQAGRPKTITGFQTHNTPVLLQHGDRAELATHQYKPLTNILENVVILKKQSEDEMELE